jgi:TetR/AcrR family transcriptional regulator, transcriptional repressor for nem operon
MSKTEQTKAFIIEKTAPLFNSKGYAATSISDITEATKLTKGSIYGNFANKDEVALAAFDYNMEKVVSILTREIAKHNSAMEKLMVYGEIYSNSERYNFPIGGCPILNTATECDDTHPALRKKVAASINTWKKVIIDILVSGIKAGEFSKNTDPEQAAFAIMALLEGSIMIARVTGNPAYNKLIKKSLEKYLEQLR